MKLHDELLRLRRDEKRITSEILDKLQVMEDRRGYLKLGYSSLFSYLVSGLGYSESTAYQRQACVRLAKDVPEIKNKIDSGALTLSTVTTAFKHIKKSSPEKKKEVLESIENKSAREVKKIFAEPMKPIRIKRTEFKDKVYLRLELTHEQNQKLEKLKALKSHSHNLESLLETLIDKELKAFEPAAEKAAKKSLGNESGSSGTRASTSITHVGTGTDTGNSTPKTKSSNPRYIPRRIRNQVLSNANFKCEHPGCEENHFLQVDHIVPVRKGGSADRDNLQVLCGAHNRLKG